MRWVGVNKRRHCTHIKPRKIRRYSCSLEKEKRFLGSSKCTAATSYSTRGEKSSPICIERRADTKLSAAIAPKSIYMRLSSSSRMRSRGSYQVRQCLQGQHCGEDFSGVPSISLVLRVLIRAHQSLNNATVSINPFRLSA